MTERKILGLLAEFDSPEHLLFAAKQMAAAGYSSYDCHSPFPIHGMDDAMQLKRSPLGWIVGFIALAGALAGLLLQGWTSSIAYPLIISGKPFFSYPAFLPVTFGLAVLAGAISAVVGMIWLNKLPKFYHMVFYSDRFERTSTDGFFLSVESDDPLFSPDITKAFLQDLGGKHIEILMNKLPL
jgi:hypothetical protein